MVVAAGIKVVVSRAPVGVFLNSKAYIPNQPAKKTRMSIKPIEEMITVLAVICMCFLSLEKSLSLYRYNWHG